MAFVKVVKGSQGVTRTEAGLPDLRMGAHRNKTGKTIYLALTIGLVEQVGWKITSATEKRKTISVLINEGVGEDAGFLLLTEDETGYVLGVELDRSYSYATNIVHSRLKHYVLNEDTVEVHSVEYTIDEKEKSILVQCPDWLRYNPQSYKEPEKPKLELTPPPTQPKREDKKPSRPTVKLNIVEGDDRKEVQLNREQRRKIVAGVTRAMR